MSGVRLCSSLPSFLGLLGRRALTARVGRRRLHGKSERGERFGGGRRGVSLAFLRFGCSGWCGRLLRLECRRCQVLGLRGGLALSLVLFGGRWCAGRWLVVGWHRLLARFSGQRCRGGRDRLGARLVTGARGIDLDNEGGGLGRRSGLEGVKVIVCRQSALLGRRGALAYHPICLPRGRRRGHVLCGAAGGRCRAAGGVRVWRPILRGTCAALRGVSRRKRAETGAEYALSFPCQTMGEWARCTVTCGMAAVGDTFSCSEAKLLSMHKQSQSGRPDKARPHLAGQKVDVPLPPSPIQNGPPFRRPPRAPAAPPAASPGLPSAPPCPRNSGRPKGARLLDRRTPEAAPRPPRPGPRGSRALQPRPRRRARLSPHLHLRLCREKGGKGLWKGHE